MSLVEIARITKIPAASLRLLEAGRFGELPGDVFVRGFLRSYARCLKMDGDTIVSQYAKCGLCPAPVSSELAEAILGQKSLESARPRRFPNATQNPPVSQEPTLGAEGKAEEVVRSVLRDAFDLRNWRPSAPKELDHEQSDSAALTAPRVRSFVPPNLAFNDDMSHRGPLTLGVIILVIVATLTMSFLLRRPGASVDGFTMAPTTPKASEPSQLSLPDRASSLSVAV